MNVRRRIRLLTTSLDCKEKDIKKKAWQLWCTSLDWKKKYPKSLRTSSTRNTWKADKQFNLEGVPCNQTKDLRTNKGNTMHDMWQKQKKRKHWKEHKDWQSSKPPWCKWLQMNQKERLETNRYSKTEKFWNKPWISRTRIIEIDYMELIDTEQAQDMRANIHDAHADQRKTWATIRQQEAQKKRNKKMSKQTCKKNCGATRFPQDSFSSPSSADLASASRQATEKVRGSKPSPCTIQK